MNRKLFRHPLTEQMSEVSMPQVSTRTLATRLFMAGRSDLELIAYQQSARDRLYHYADKDFVMRTIIEAGLQNDPRGALQLLWALVENETQEG